MGLWHVWLPPPLVLWVPESCPPVAACGEHYEAGWSPYRKKIADIDAWRPEASMPGWPGWLACLAWLWLAWLDRLEWLAEILTRSTL